MTPRNQLMKRMEEFLRCRLAEHHPGGRCERLYERPSIMISRQAGARGAEVARELADYLDEFDETAEHGWAIFDQSLLAKVIEERLLPDMPREYLVPNLPDADPHEVVTSMMKTPPAEWTFFQHSADAIRRLCRLGNVIILGRGGNFLTQDLANSFHVRLVGDPGKRVRAVAAENDLEEEKATDYMQALDQARATYVRRNLDRDIEADSSYHLTINISRLDPFSSARIIGDTVIEWAGARLLPMSA